MPILAVDTARGTFDQVCRACGLVRRGLALDPARGDVRVNASVRSLTIRACPQCRAAPGAPHVSEHLYLGHTGFEAQEEDAPLPDWSIQGQRDATNGVVVAEHHIGTHHDPQRVQQARLIRQMQRHPHLAPHAPLHEHWLASQSRGAAGVHDHDALDGMAVPVPAGRVG